MVAGSGSDRAPVYLDYNATAPLRAAARAAMSACLAELEGEPGNPSSVHRFGRVVHRRMENARERLAAALGAPREGVIFTSGATEANNMVLAGIEGVVPLVSAIEHPSLDAPARAMSARRLPADAQGRIAPEAVAAALADLPAAEGGRPLVSVMLANNETGVLQPVAEIAGIVHAAGGWLHCDATQGLGRVPLDLAALGADMVTLSAHKCGGPPGVGALVLTGDTAPEPLQLGGGQESYRRPGTENLPGIVGFAAAAEAAIADLESFAALAPLRDRIEAAAAAGGAVLFGQESPRLANTAMIALPGLGAETQLMKLDLAGYAVSSGSACSSGKVRPSHVLAAMGADADLAAAAIRVSLPPGTEEADVAGFIAAWSRMAARHRRADGAA